tara:strand:+ start:98 stop:298 length:201 start_codon:yes stop_codon:yes gene_type:complete
MANKFDHYGSEESDNNNDFDFGSSLPDSSIIMKKQDTTVMKKNTDVTKTMNDSDDSDQMFNEGIAP